MLNPDLEKQKTFHPDKAAPQINGISTQIKFLCFFVFGFMVTQQNPNCIQVDAPLLHSFFFNTYVKDRVHVLRCLHSFDLLFGSSKLLHFFVLPQFVFQICSPFSPVETTTKICLKFAGGNVTRDNQKVLRRTIGMVKGIIWVLHAAWQFPPTRKSCRSSYSN